MKVGYEFAIYTTEEDEGLALCAVVMNFPSGSPAPFTLSATTADGEGGNINLCCSLEHNYYVLTGENGVDYIGVKDAPLIFGVGDHRVCHRIQTLNDSLCELSPTEYFFSYLEYKSATIPIIIGPDRTRIIINDTRGCGKCKLVF